MSIPISEQDRGTLAIQSASRTAKQWVEYFDNKYNEQQLRQYCRRHSYPLARMSTQERSKINSQNAKATRQYHINQDYFKTWSPNMAYILGFWYADGCIYNNRIFDITIHKKDKYILKKIAEELEYEGPLYDYVDRQAARLNFSCKDIYNDLVALGGTERKSNTLVFPKDIVPLTLMPDFIRGYFDGDGCIMNLKNNRVNSAFTCGSKSFLDDLLSFLQEYADVQGGSYDASCVSLKFGKKDTLKIGNYIYQNNPELYLKRKKDKFDIANGEPKRNPVSSLNEAM